MTWHLLPSPTPAGPTRLALRWSRLGPRYVHNEGSHDQINLSGLHHTAWTLAVYASQSGLPQNHARLASRCWPGLVTRKIPTKGFRVVSLHLVLPSQASWRKDISNSCGVQAIGVNRYINRLKTIRKRIRPGQDRRLVRLRRCCCCFLVILAAYLPRFYSGTIPLFRTLVVQEGLRHGSYHRSDL